MTASQPNLLELAKQGDARAIAALMNRQLQPKGITAKVALKDMCLQVMLESASTPNQEALVAFLRKGIAGLGAASIERVKIYGKQINEDSPSWNQEFELIMQADSIPVNVEIQSDSKASVTRTTITPSSQITHQSSYSSAKATTLVKEKTSEEKIADWVFGIFLILAIVSLFINWLLAFLLFGIACLAAGGTKEGKTALEKKKLEAENKLEIKQHESKTQQEPVVTVALQKANLSAQKANLSAKELLNGNEQITFQQMASYRGGLRGYPNSSKIAGCAYVLNHSFVFYDSLIAFKLPHDRIIEAKLDFFQMGGTRAFLASGDVGRQLQQTKNTLDLYYIDEEGIERNAKFQIHGAATIYGEAERAREFLNQLLEFKGSFLDRSQNNGSDPISKLEKLKKLKEQGIITDSEFESKKKQLLDQL